MGSEGAGREGVWLFGYGSLVWRPAFDASAVVGGRVTGWRRRFWQGSPDHRGVPGALGRVLTVVPDRSAVCWGRAYRLTPDQAEAVLPAVDHRESGGYVRDAVSVALDDGRRVEALVYRATPDNPHWLGPASLGRMADRVVRSVGPSGPNTEYVLRLDQALRDAGEADPHVHALAEAVRARLG